MKASQVKELLKTYNWKGQGEFLKDCLIELNSWTYYGLEELYCELITDKFNSIEEILEIFDDKVDAARAVYFGNIKNWNDDYFYLDGYGNIVSQNEFEYLRDFEKNGCEIIMCILEHYDIDINNIKDLIKHIENEIL